MVGSCIWIDKTQFPDVVRKQLVESLRSRRVNHKFHYDSYKQAQKWLALHEAYSPARKDADCEQIYDLAFQAAVRDLLQRRLEVVGLGCATGQKELKLLKLAKRTTENVAFKPCDVSVALVLMAKEKAEGVVEPERCAPFVCDLAEVDAINRMFGSPLDSGTMRVFTFFGMIPNFEPDVILPKLRTVMRRGDLLLFSANLSPGNDYGAGVRTILPQYDNDLTKEWLLTFLLDLGVERSDGKVVMTIEETLAGYFRIVAYFEFLKERSIRLGDERFTFNPGEEIRLFFSYRYQPKHIIGMLNEQGIGVAEQFITDSGEEGVFVCKLI